MTDAKIEVSSYAGYQGEESPRIFFSHGEKITVLKVLEMWIEEGEADRKRKRYFRLHGSDGFVHKVYLDCETSLWYQQSFEKIPRKN